MRVVALHASIAVHPLLAATDVPQENLTHQHLVRPARVRGEQCVVAGVYHGDAVNKERNKCGGPRSGRNAGEEIPAR